MGFRGRQAFEFLLVASSKGIGIIMLHGVVHQNICSCHFSTIKVNKTIIMAASTALNIKINNNRKITEKLKELTKPINQEKQNILIILG